MADVANNDRKVKLSKNGKVIKTRTRNPEEWHKQKQKRLRIAGKEYINTKGEVVPAKEPGPDCNCRRRCFQKVPKETRLKAFEGFYAMKSHDEQNAYLFGLMRQVDVKRKRVKSSNRRTCTFEYYVRVKGRETQVCQTAFKNIHAITERKVRVLCQKMDDGIMYPNDGRGKNSHRRTGEVRLPPGVFEQIKNHIYSIVHTHRLKDFIRLDKIAGLEINISKMWKDYIKTYDPDNIMATLPRTKKMGDGSPPHVEIQQQQPLPPAPQETLVPVTYASSGHIVNITADNYFQNQYQTASLASVPPGNFYQTNGGQSVGIPIILQQSAQRTSQPTTAFILLSTKPETSQQTATITIDNSYSDNATIIVEHEKPQKKERKGKRKGPIVKPWRYTNIFHDEINGAALAAIKTRLGMYYAESDAARKKAKQTRPSDIVPAEVPTEQMPQMRPTHVTTYA